MTRTQTRTYGVMTPSSRQPLLAAMLRVFVWLASNVVSKARTIFNRNTRDWHTDEAQEGQLRTLTDISETGSNRSSPSFSGSSREFRLFNPRGTTPHSPAAYNRDARHKAEHDTTVGVAARTIWKRVQRTRAPTKAQLSPRSYRRTSVSRADRAPCPALQLQACIRSSIVPGFRASS